MTKPGGHMAEKHPYTSGGGGGIEKTVAQLRSSFPAAVTVDTFRRLDIAKGNEKNLIRILKFIGVLDDQGKKIAKAGQIFARADDEFKDGFSELIKAGYADLFALHAEKAWTLGSDKLIAFFRTADGTSALVGSRQALTFHTLAGICGKAEGPATRGASAPTRSRMPKAAKSSLKKISSFTPTPPGATHGPNDPQQEKKRLPSIHIDVQVHISPDTTPEQIDRIFASMSKHLAGFVS
jgi:hypothetical protein